MGPIEETIKALGDELLERSPRGRENMVKIYSELINVLVSNTSAGDRVGANLTIYDFIKRVRSGKL